jgi:RNA polymerase sigma-70 factor (ECF subfamily)
MTFDSKEKNSESASSGNFVLDELSFETFFKSHFLSLCSYCQYKFGFDLDLAKEIVHTAFIKLWETRQSLDNDLSPKAYLYRIIVNTSLDALKHHRVRKIHEEFVQKTTHDETYPNSFDSVDLKQMRSDIDSAILDLPDQMRRIFELSRFEGLKYSEIATRLDISIKTVETQMSRALVKLREKLSSYLTLCLIMLILSILKK